MNKKTILWGTFGLLFICLSVFASAQGNYNYEYKEPIDKGTCIYEPNDNDGDTIAQKEEDKPNSDERHNRIDKYRESAKLWVSKNPKELIIDDKVYYVEYRGIGIFTGMPVLKIYNNDYKFYNKVDFSGEIEIKEQKISYNIREDNVDSAYIYLKRMQ